MSETFQQLSEDLAAMHELAKGFEQERFEAILPALLQAGDSKTVLLLTHLLSHNPETMPTNPQQEAIVYVLTGRGSSERVQQALKLSQTARNK